MSNSLTPDLKLLQLLKKQDNPALLTEIERELDVSHGELLNKLDVLDALGYLIELHPYLGVRLLDIPDRLLEYEIRDGLNTKLLGKKLNIFEKCVSTSDEAWQAIEKRKVEDGEIFIADAQTSARGRMGRSWHAPTGTGLYLSFVARTKVAPDRISYLTSSIALAIASTIEQFVHLPAEIKWPNDILIGGRKTAGILVESRSNIPDTYVIGIGLNVNQRVSDFPEAISETATSLRQERGKVVHRIRLLRPLLFYLDSVYNQLRRKKYERIARAWGEYVNIAGKKALLRAKGEDVEGTVVRVNLDEGITIELEGGMTRTYKTEHVASMREVSQQA